MSTDWLPGVHAAPNIQGDARVYEIENEALDPEGRITAAMRTIRGWDDAVVCDLGAGTGFWARTFVDQARHVFLVEPHGPSRLIAHQRAGRMGWQNCSVLVGSAEQTHLASQSMDLVHARFAYFWGPKGEAGLAEVDRILRPGGAFVVIDNNLRQGTFASWIARIPSNHRRDPDLVDTWWRSHGFSITEVPSCWRFSSRTDLEAVVRLEFGDLAGELLDEHQGLEVEYVYRLFWRCADRGQASASR